MELETLLPYDDYFSQLPNEIIVEILKYLPSYQLLSARKVCKRWNIIIIQCKWLWTELKMDTRPIAVKPLKNLIRQYLNEFTTEIEICGFGAQHKRPVTITNDVLKALARKCPLLKRLELERIYLKNTSLQFLPTNIEHLKFTKSEIPLKNLQGCSETFTRLRSLTLKRCPCITHAHISGFGNLNKLERFYANGCYRIDDEAVRILAGTSSKTLKYLTLLGCAFCGDESAEIISTQLNQLEMIEIEEWIRLSQPGAQQIVDGCPKLKLFSCKCTQLNMGALKMIGSRMDIPIFR